MVKLHFLMQIYIILESHYFLEIQYFMFNVGADIQYLDYANSAKMSQRGIRKKKVGKSQAFNGMGCLIFA